MEVVKPERRRKATRILVGSTRAGREYHVTGLVDPVSAVQGAWLD